MYKKEAIQRILKDMYKKGMRPGPVKSLYRLIIQSPPEGLVLMNPNIMAVKLDLEQVELLDMVVLGVVCGLFEMQWDMACPHCHGVADHSHDMSGLSAHSHCRSCKADFDNFADENITVAISLNPALYEGQAPRPPERRALDPRVRPVSALELIGAPLFRKYFSSQVPAVDQSVKIRSVTVLFTDLIQSTRLYNAMGDLQAYAFVKEHFDILFSHIVHNAGGVIKTIGDAVMAVFREPVDAVRAAFELKQSVNRLFEEKGQKKESYGLRVSISNGTALIVNMNDVLDLFGTTVNVSARIIKFSEKDSVAATPGITEDKKVGEYLSQQGIGLKSLNERLKGFSGLNRVDVLSAKGKWFSRLTTGKK